MIDWQSIPKRHKVAWLVLLAGLLATGYAAYSVKVDTERDAQRRFASDCREIQLKIEARLQVHKQVLLGGVALFDASDNVDRNAWRAYSEHVEIDQHFNGIQGLGFALWIPKNQLARHLSEIRRQGFPDYIVSPAGERDAYSSIIYLEPFKDRNLRAFGYDMYSEPVRRAAMEQARDENIISLSGKVKLVQETGREVQAGTLMYAPVYRKSTPLDTIEQRRAALYGWVYSPFRIDDLLHGVLKGRDNPQQRYLRLQVYDGSSTQPKSLLYNSEANQKASSPSAVLFTLDRRTNFNGHEWTLHFEQLKGSMSGIDYSKAWMMLGGGLSLSILSFFLMLSYLNTRRNAVAIADELTAELRTASGYARSLLETSLDPLVTINPNGKITDVNEGSIKVTGVGREELIGTDFSDYFTEPDKARASYQQVFAEGFVTNYPLAIRHRDGHITDVLYNASVYRNEAGDVLGVFAAARDITELKRTIAELRALKGELEIRVAERTMQLEAANKELEAFSYSVSHDLRTPLRAIDGFSHILLEDYADKLDEEGRRLLNVVRDNTSRMGQLIDDILKFSRTGRMELTFSDIDMEKLAHDVFEELHPTGGNLQLEIEALPGIPGDSAMMRQVFVNLLSNAIKFSRLKDTARIKVAGAIEGNEAIYYVQDNGAGFDMQYVDKLFGVFQRLHGVTEFEGTGIGLAIVKRIVTRHGGRVWAEGKVNQGATIYFALPIKEKDHG